MASYWSAIVITATGLIGVVGLLLWAARSVRRFGALAAAYRRGLVAETALLRYRRVTLVADLARRRGRLRGATPRTMR